MTEPLLVADPVLPAEPLRLAVVGAGLIGREHAQRILDRQDMELSFLVDPFVDAKDHPFAGRTTLVADLAEALPHVDGAILATPNHLHESGALSCIDAGVPVLVEKPLADTPQAAERIVTAGESRGVPVLVGHHRRYSPLLEKAVEAISAGVIGRPVAVMGSALFSKPDAYFDAAPWRQQAGGGPILINLIHDMDNLRALCGEIVRVQATSSNQARGFEVEDTAALTLTFANGALGTFIVSDSAASARSWEQTARENPSYDFADDEDCYHLAGTRGSISVPTLRVRSYEGEASWWEKSAVTSLNARREDPLVRQLEHFGQVIRGQAQPRVTARDGLQSLRVVLAVAESARTGLPVDIPVYTD
ncbi:Gfo/Idh/MocA family protein [Citricoccus sp. GCM10030269]|uniref:Gfo/Idh/MocA family protein n=1 Tax=Citricoccus sp. GCM10030269 TaxID=3273388 RepID=UPI003613FB7B